MRDVYAAYLSFVKKLLNFVKYLRLTRNLESRFPDATQEEIAAAGNCLVCREEMETGKKLPCGHIFHLTCLRTWLQHQQSCPLCRADIPVSNAAAEAAAPVNNDAAAEVRTPTEPTESYTDSNAAQDTGAVVTVTTTASSSPLLSSLLLNFGTPTAAGEVQFPNFFMVLADSPIAIRSLPMEAAEQIQPVAIRSLPMETAEQIRFLNKGTIVFVVTRVVDSNGWPWLKAPDGWMLESKPPAGAMQLAPLKREPSSSSSEKADSSQSQKSTSTAAAALPTPTVGSPDSSEKVYNRAHFLSRFSANESKPAVDNNHSKMSSSPPPPIVTHSAAVDPAPLLDQPSYSLNASSPLPTPLSMQSLSTRADRLQALLRLQLNMEVTTQRLVELGQSLLASQQALSTIIKEELKHATDDEGRSVKQEDFSST
eukprot:CAMPEP_0170127136 /NCGR_PEP_ID=MMETSP0020_2-20130122/20221_1 /TAXON_ID=98059 /ORGANISM="Dinobryon sp., Strain UTEXLB2267" /LENGTH=424 /DNA_ID=CAMNT_0010360459 /DNA_START=46 /DNA_END=1320 /DNA_ORIENTATION=+